ncbi:ent-kaurene oxidase-like protein 1 [Amborella trichopoda]|uniref:ent-kaurene oxidase-like protein 1 n=1 Tax=Amborella trichopoda TaxID=13333 RepID=UPI0005D3FEBD|nr:ent-kaurene oxidase-like protein 1 [Amborella trichopoda]|eukprot:XP_011626890.1 ent-kaurene oxidase-like protein 1 [Amborella trichopoda]
MELSPESWRVSGAAAALGLLLWLLTHRALKAKNGSLRSPPAVPGWPVIGNLHQMKGAVPHILFTKWARKYGPLYTIKTGTTTLVVVTSSELAREVMVTRFPSFSTRKLSWIFMLATADKWMVAMADYGERHKLLKRYYLSSVLNPNSQV